MALTVRTPRIEDAAALGRVHVRAWQAAYSGGLMPDEYLESLSEADRGSMWRDMLEDPPPARSARLVADIDGEVVGFALCGPARGSEDAESGELYAINVDPDHWGAGAGRSMINAAIESLRTFGFAKVVLWVHPGNDRARRFYVRGGWIGDEVGRHEEVFGIEVPEARFSLSLGE